MLRAPTRRVMVRTSTAMAALALLMLLAGCGSSSKPAAKTLTGTIAPRTSTVGHVKIVRSPAVLPPGPAQIRRAALLTAAKPGYRAKLSASIRVPQFGAGPLTAVGSGYFDSKSGTGTVGIALRLPGLLGLSGVLPSQVIAVGHKVYVRFPSELLTLAPTLKPWGQATLSQLDLGTLNPSVILGQVARDATRKIPDQQAKVTINPKTGLIRTIVLTYYEPGPRIHVVIHLTLTGFGHEPASDAPAPDQVSELLPALQALGL